MKRLKTAIENMRGLTLVEMIVVLSLLSMVLAVGYTFLFSGLNTFNIAEGRSEVQRVVRLAGDFITREVRYAHEMEIINPTESDDFIDTTYYYIYQDGSSIKYRKEGEGIATNILNGISDEVAFQLHFTKDGRMINYSIHGSKDGESPYEIDSDVLILNLTAVNGLHSNQAIRFKRVDF